MTTMLMIMMMMMVVVVVGVYVTGRNKLGSDNTKRGGEFGGEASTKHTIQVKMKLEDAWGDAEVRVVVHQPE